MSLRFAPIAENASGMRFHAFCRPFFFRVIPIKMPSLSSQGTMLGETLKLTPAMDIPAGY